MLTRVLVSISMVCAAGAASAQCSTGTAQRDDAPSVQAVAHRAAPGTVVEVAEKAGMFNTLLAAAKAGGLVPALNGPGPITVFAPSDDAFAKLPAGTVETLLKRENRGMLKTILTAHVVSGRVGSEGVMGMTSAETLSGQRVGITLGDGWVRVGGAKVVKADIEASNGVIHVIDSVIMPATDDLITTAASAGSFSTLAAAIEAAGLARALQGDGPFTVFAPTDEAFAALPAGTVESLLERRNRGKLAEILKFHVVAGRVYAGDAASAQSAETLQGQALRISIDGGRLMVNDASIIATDVEATNGVIHVIDRVLMPSN